MADEPRLLATATLGATVGGGIAGLWLGSGWTALGTSLLAAAGTIAALSAVLPWRPSTASARQGPRNPEPAALPAGFGRYLLDQMPLGVLLIDRRGRVQLINPMASRLFGRQPEGAFHMSALRAPRFLEAIEGALESGAATEVAFSLRRAEAAYLKASIQPLPSETARESGLDAPALIVTIEDHSRAHQAEVLHRDFVANASHELKTPLASISGIIETLTGHARDDPEATERFLRLMANQTSRMTRLVADLLSLNRIEINERVRPDQPQPVRRIASEVAQSFEAAAEAAGMTIEADPPADLPTVLGDREELAQLFSNLIDNALRYGSEGTTVQMRFRGAPQDPQTGIAVIDRGVGISREHLPRLTERFYRVSAASSRARGGTGLGLAIVKHIVNRHQGELAVESTPGEGSIFTVWLPVHQAARTRTPKPTAGMAEPRQA